MRITNYIKQLNNIGSTAHILQNLNFTLDLLFLHGFQDLNDAFRVVCDIDSLKDLHDVKGLKEIRHM